MIWISSRWPSAALLSFLPLSMCSPSLGCLALGVLSQPEQLGGNPELPWRCEGILDTCEGWFFKNFKVLWWFLSSLGNDDLAVWGWLLISPFVFGWVVQHSWHNKSCWGGLGGCLSFSCLSADTCLVTWSEKTHLCITGKIRKIVCEIRRNSVGVVCLSPSFSPKKLILSGHFHPQGGVYVLKRGGLNSLWCVRNLWRVHKIVTIILKKV